MLSLSFRRRNSGSSLTSLCQDAGPVKPSFLPFGVSWTLLCTVKATLLGWNGGFVGKRHKRAWQMAPLCIFWSVWKERTRLAFGNEDLSLQMLKYSFVCNIWSWVRGSLVESFFSCKFCRLDRLLVRKGGVYTPCILRGLRFVVFPLFD